MDTKITIREHAPAENSTELSEKMLSQITGGAFNAFLNFGDVEGESTDRDHKDWIELL